MPRNWKNGGVILRWGVIIIYGLLVPGCSGCSQSNANSNGAAPSNQANSPTSSCSTRAPTDEILADIQRLPVDAKEYSKHDSYAFSDSHLAALRNHRKIEVFDISGCPNTSDKGIAAALAGRKLKTVLLANSGAGDETLACLAAMETVERLDLGLCDNVSDAGMAKLAPTNKLMVLSLNGIADLTDTGLRALLSAKGLRELDISWCGRITNPAVGEICQALPLQVLKARNTPLSDELLKLIAGSKSLKTIDMRQCPSITDAGVAEFQSKTPGCRVER